MFGIRPVLSGLFSAASRQLHLGFMSVISFLVVVGSVTGFSVATAPASSAASAAAPAAQPARIGSAPRVPANAVSAGALAPSTELNVLVTLQPRNPAALANFATAVSTPGNPLYKHYLAPGQFPNVYGPTPAAISAVDSALKAAGLQPGTIAATHLYIPVTATAAQLSSAFSTSFEQYRIDSRLAYGNTSAPLIPGSAAPYVQGVIGLDNLNPPETVGLTKAHVVKPLVAPHVVTGGPQPCSAASTAGPENDAYTADQLASAYRLSSLYGASDFGAGVTVALFELEPNLTTDISAYQSCYGTSATVSYIKVDGGAGTGAGEGEAALDIEDVIGLAPKANVDVYQAPNSDTGLEEDYADIESQDVAKSVSTSWGECEAEDTTAVADAENTDFEDMAGQGQSMFSAAGDNGSEDCDSSALGVDDPASQPYVTGVGGTTLSALGPPPTEVVWDEVSKGGGAGGGGVSEVWPMATYQSGAPSALNVINTNSSKTTCSSSTVDCREVPDVTADADPYTGYVIYYNGSWTGIGGTSAAAPFWAAFTALTDASATCDGTPIGFANPKLYAAAATTNGYTQDFQDITSGNNDYEGTNSGKFPAGTHYDMASGLGSPDGEYLPAALCSGTVAAPTITSISPTSGTTAGGTSVTITGTNLTSATAVKFGSNSATVSSDTATSIVAVTPAGSAGAVSVAVTTAGGTATDASAYTYVTPAPTITSVSPTSGTTAGGTSVTITGTNLTSATAVKFGSNSATVSSDTATSIVAVTPAGSAGAVSVAVTTAGGTATDASAYTYVTPAPTITSISPTSGTTAGGTSVTITGTNLTSATAVTFGGTAATVSSDTATSIVAVTPADSAGAVSVAVTTAGGTATDAGAYTYVTPAPTITSVSPSSGTTLGGTSVTITGTNLTSATAVKFGSNSATVTSDTATSIVATTPAGTAGAGSVAVTTAGGTATDAGAYTYVTPAPTITSVSPTSGPTAGGTSVTITGTNLASATAVTFGGIAATISSDTATSIVATAPAGSAGAVSLAVTTAGGTATDAGAFTYYVPGLLRVTTSPAVPSRITLNGNIADTWGLTWAKEAPGTYSVCFSDVQGYTAPSCQSVSVTAGATTTVTGTFVQRGYLQVTTSPAVNSEITYELSPSTTPIPMDNYGAWTDLPVGSYSVCFGAVAGYTPPACQAVSVTAGATTAIIGDFTADASATGPSSVGLLRVTTSPAVASQITVNGNIADTYGLSWLQLPAGSDTVCFSDVPGYLTPACQSVTVSVNATTTVTGTFVENGYLQVETSPAVAGTISINGIPADDWGVYTDVPVGTYSVCFGAVSGFTAPVCQTPSVTAGSTTTITGMY